MRRAFAPVETRVLGVFLFGSQVTGRSTGRSDVDVCIVAGPGADPWEVLGHSWEATRADPRYDIKVFEELPLFLKGAVLDEGVLLLSRDRVGLSEYLWHWRKLWSDQRHRVRLRPEEEARLWQARRERRARA